MSPTEVEVRNSAPTRGAASRIVDGATYATHLTHDSELAQSVIEDAIEDKIYAAKRALMLARRRVEQLGDYKDDVVRYVKRRPLASASFALASGLAVGVAFGWIIGHRRQCDDRERLVENR